MSDTAGKPYRIVARKTAILLLVPIAGLGALAVWFGLAWVELYADKMSDLFDSDPDQARIKLIGDLKIVAIATGASFWALAVLIFRYGLKSLRARSIPPRGSWVIEGQRIRAGPGAVFHAKLLLAIGAFLCLLGIVATATLWRVPIALLAGQ